MIMIKQTSFDKALTKAIKYLEAMTEGRIITDKDFGIVISDRDGYVTISWDEVIRAYNSEDFQLELLATYEDIKRCPFEV